MQPQYQLNSSSMLPGLLLVATVSELLDERAARFCWPSVQFVSRMAKGPGKGRPWVRTATGSVPRLPGDLVVLLDCGTLLGHRSAETTERYLGSRQRIVAAVNDKIGLEPDSGGS